MSLLPRAHLQTLALVAVLSALVLAGTASSQIYDSNFYATSEATALLAGDHPYRDFFEVGIPLDAYLSAAALWASGGRLLGEFARQWLFLVAGIVFSFHLALRRTRAVVPVLATLPLVLLLLTVTPIYHFSKLFFFPLVLLLGSRYVERPGPSRGAALALATALGFLVRHDYALYLGAASIAAFALARGAVPVSRAPRAMLRDAAAYGVVVVLVLAPWLLAVQTHEGLLRYTRVRAALMQRPSSPVWVALLHVNPFREFRPDPLPAPRSGRIAFEWDPTVDGLSRRRLERDLGLRAIEDPARVDSTQYEVSNLYDPALLRLLPFVDDTEGVPWGELLQSQSILPGRQNAMVWLHQMTLLLPVALLASAGAQWWRSRRTAGPAPPHLWTEVYAALVLAVICSGLLRERSYLLVFAPTTAALVAWFLAGAGRWRRGIALVLLALSTVAAMGIARGGVLFSGPAALTATTRESFRRLTRLPPDYGADAFRYVRECTRAGDRVLITGLTPLHASYYIGRPMAGGQINWHHAWRSDATGQQEAFALVQRQSVPFAISTSDHVLTEFRAYRRIRDRLERRYMVVEGSNGLLMVDRERTPTGRWGPLGWPCFREDAAARVGRAPS